MGQDFSLGNIIRELPIDLSEGDYIDPSGSGFFVRSTAGVDITYVPLNNVEADGEIITKTLPASEKFEDPVLIKKIFASGSPLPNDLYAGFGV